MKTNHTTIGVFVFFLLASGLYLKERRVNGELRNKPKQRFDSLIHVIDSLTERNKAHELKICYMDSAYRKLEKFGKPVFHSNEQEFGIMDTAPTSSTSLIIRYIRK